MAKGKEAPVGATRISQNGYHYTKTEGGWRLTHHLLAEKQLGRPLSDDERTRFKDGDKKNLTEDNIEVLKRGKANLRRRRAVVEARIEELQAELDHLNAKLK